jgi:hypothetical protein
MMKILMTDAIKTPAKYTNPFRFWLKSEDMTKKKRRRTGAIRENSSNKFEMVNFIDMAEDQ